MFYVLLLIFATAIGLVLGLFCLLFSSYHSATNYVTYTIDIRQIYDRYTLDTRQITLFLPQEQRIYQLLSPSSSEHISITPPLFFVCQLFRISFGLSMLSTPEKQSPKAIFLAQSKIIHYLCNRNESDEQHAHVSKQLSLKQFAYLCEKMVEVEEQLKKRKAYYQQDNIHQ